MNGFARGPGGYERRPSPQPIFVKPAPPPPPPSLEQARELVSVCTSVVAQAEREHAELQLVVTQRAKADATARELMSEAESVFDTAPSAANAKDVTATRAHVSNMELLLAKARERLAAGDGALSCARDALARAERDVRLAALDLDASIETFHERVAPLAGRFLAAIEDLRSTAAAMDAAFAASAKAAQALTAEGLHTSGLDAGHILVDVLRALAARGIAVDAHKWQSLRYALAVSGDGAKAGRAIGPMPGSIIDLLASLLDGPPPTADALAETERRLRWCGQTRTVHEAVMLEEKFWKELQREQAERNAASYRAPPERPRHVRERILGPELRQLDDAVDDE
jgi:hypothetical protein